MNRVRIGALIVVAALAASPRSLRADVRADEKTHFEFAGMLGRMVNLFGGKAAREGVTSAVAIKGNRKATMNESTGQIIDLAEEKVYDLDLKHKTYKVTTFDELRRRMEDARKKAQEDAARQRPRDEKQKAEPQDKNQKEVEVDFNVKNTGEKKNINGFDTHQVIATITVREKGKTLEQGGGLVMTNDMWLAPRVAAMKEIVDFDIKYAQKLYGGTLTGVSAEQMATAMAMYPSMKDAMSRMSTETAKLDGTPILTTFTIESVKSNDEMAQQATERQQQEQSENKDAASSGLGGLFNKMASKAAAKKMGADDSANKQRATFMTGTNEVLKIATDVSPADVAVPTGFKENK